MKPKATIALIALAGLISVLAGTPAPASPLPQVSQSADGVTVKRNADGTLEVYDTPESDNQSTVANRSKNWRANASSSQSTSSESAAKSETASLQTEDSVFAVKPVVSARKKPRPGPAHKTWSHSISAL
jgi:hypothetical protein